ncbi:MAG: protocatechuate 3,4-dioxygenase, partial [Gammaproteobacteria bacterium]|nr:protocatechuate 3,4-dioxygenase [Gammaproteobacteria bacterium]
MNEPDSWRRRRLLLGMMSLPVSTLAGAALTTPSGTEGPFYPTPGMRFDDSDNDLVQIDGVVERAGGEIVRLSGRVLNQAGNPVAGARVEIWQCDVHGRYLHRGDSGGAARDAAFQGFGHAITTEDGSYGFRTIKPVPYPGRTPHIHAKVLVDGRERLTTQFYLPDHPLNDRDWLYRRIPADRRELVTLRFTGAAAEPEARLDLVI